MVAAHGQFEMNAFLDSVRVQIAQTSQPILHKIWCSRALFHIDHIGYSGAEATGNRIQMAYLVGDIPNGLIRCNRVARKDIAKGIQPLYSIAWECGGKL